MPERARRGGSAMVSVRWGGLSWPKLSTTARASLQGMVVHAAARRGTEADRSRHQAPAGRADRRSCAWRAVDLARRRAAHHHPLGARRFLLVGLRTQDGAAGAAAGPRAPCADQARE